MRCATPPSLRLALAAAALLAADACCCAGPPRGALSTPPDHECMTGLEGGYDIAVWDCLDGGRVVAYRWSSTVGCSGVTVQRAACGELTTFETRLSDEDLAFCFGLPPDGGQPDGGQPDGG